MLNNVPHFELDTPPKALKSNISPFILEKGSIPIVENFEEKEIYKNVGVYTYTRITNNEFLFRPTEKQIREVYLKKYRNLDLLIGKKCHTNEARAIFNEIAHNFKPSEDEYFNQLINKARKIAFINDDFEKAFDMLCLHVYNGSPKIPYHFSPADLSNVIECAKKKPYKELKKALVFNQNYQINPIARTYYQNIAIGQINEDSLKELLHLSLTIPQYSEILGQSESTVKRNLRKFGVSTKGNKKTYTINQIRKCHKLNPKWSKKKVAEHLKMSYRNVKRLWKEI